MATLSLLTLHYHVPCLMVGIGRMRRDRSTSDCHLMKMTTASEAVLMVHVPGLGQGQIREGESVSTAHA